MFSMPAIVSTASSWTIGSGSPRNCLSIVTASFSGSDVPQRLDGFTAHVDAGMALRQLDQLVHPALVLEVAERFHGLALNVEIGVLAGNRCQRVGRRPLGTSAERFDRLASRVPIRQ